MRDADFWHDLLEEIGAINARIKKRFGMVSPRDASHREDMQPITALIDAMENVQERKERAIVREWEPSPRAAKEAR